jgi:rare lipoprotein A
MIRILLAAALGCALASPAIAADNPANFLAGIRSIDVVMTRDPPPKPKRAKVKDGPETCTASQYGVGDGYHGKRTASGSIFNTWADNPFTVAHLTRPFGSWVTVTNLSNGRSIRAVVTDRGPFYHARCVDVGRAGANALGMGGTARVRVE